MKLKRRFLKDRKITSAFIAKSQSRQKIQREVSSMQFGSEFMQHYVRLLILLTVSGDSEATESGEGQQDCDVQEVQSGRVA